MALSYTRVWLLYQYTAIYNGASQRQSALGLQREDEGHQNEIDEFELKYQHQYALLFHQPCCDSSCVHEKGQTIYEHPACVFQSMHHCEELGKSDMEGTGILDIGFPRSSS